MHEDSSHSKFSLFVIFLWCLWDSFWYVLMDIRSSCFFSLSLPLHRDDRCYDLSHSKKRGILILRNQHGVFHYLMFWWFYMTYLYIYFLFGFVFHQGTLSDAWQEGTGSGSTPCLKSRPQTPCLDLETHSFFDSLCALFIILYPRSFFHLGISSSWIWFGVCTWLGLGKEKDTKYHRLAARRAKTRHFGVAEMWDERCQHGTSRGRIRCCAKDLCLFGLGKWMASANWIRRFCWVRGCTSGKQMCRCSVELLCRI